MTAIFVFGLISFLFFQKLVSLSAAIDRLDDKAYAPASAGVSVDSQASTNPTDQRLKDVELKVKQLESFTFLQKDEKGWSILKESDVNFLAIANGFTLPVDWYATPSLQGVKTSVVETDGYRLHIPFNPRWGNETYTIAPFEQHRTSDGGQQVSFGPITFSEMAGATRYGWFDLVEKRTPEEVLVAPEYQSTACGSDTFQPTLTRVGSHQVMRIVNEECEGLLTTYLVFGKRFNYLFVGRDELNEAFLRWMVERFEEK